MHWSVFFSILQTVLKYSISRVKNQISRILVSGPYALISSMDVAVDHLLLRRSFLRIFECLSQSMQLQLRRLV